MFMTEKMTSTDYKRLSKYRKNGGGGIFNMDAKTLDSFLKYRNIKSEKKDKKIKSYIEKDKINELTNFLVKNNYGVKINKYTIKSIETDIEYTFNKQTRRYKSGKLYLAILSEEQFFNF